jgi:hypothetical protein
MSKFANPAIENIFFSALNAPLQSWYEYRYSVVGGSPREAMEFLVNGGLTSNVRVEISSDRKELVINVKVPNTIGFIENRLRDNGFGLWQGKAYLAPYDKD